MSVINRHAPVAGLHTAVLIQDSREPAFSRPAFRAVFLALVTFLSLFSASAQINEYFIPFFNPARPEGIVRAPDGAYWFAQFSGYGIGRIDTNGLISEPVYFYPTNIAPFKIIVGPDTNLWFTEGFMDSITRVNPGTNGAYTNGVITRFQIHPGVNTNCEPSGLTVGPDGNLWFLEYFTSRVGVMNTNGVVLHEYGAGVIQTNAQLYNIVSGSDGNLWFTEETYGRIGRITTAGAITEFQLASNCEPFDIVAGPDGALWFTEFNSNRIGRLTTSGAYSDFVLPSTNLNGNLNFSQEPYGITVSPDGNMWFTEFSGGNIGRITPSGVITEFPTPTFGSGPRGIASGPDRGIWFGEYNVNANAIGRFNMPTLTILLNSNSQFVLSWPASASAFTLQGNTNLGTTNWINLNSPPPVLVSNSFVYTNTNAGVEFFRLFAP